MQQPGTEFSHLNTDGDLVRFLDRLSRKAILAIAYKNNSDPQCNLQVKQ